MGIKVIIRIGERISKPQFSSPVERFQEQPLCGSTSQPHTSMFRFVHGAMGRRIDPSWGGPIELFLVPASAPRLV